MKQKASRPAPATTAGTVPWRRHVLPLLALWLLAILAYSNSFRGGFVFDNDWVILQDSRVHAVTPDNLKLIFTEDYSYQHSSSGLYRPLTTLSFLFNYAILGNGSEPAGYHAVNLGLHLLNIGLVYWLGLVLFPEAGVLPAGALAALWGLHPVLTESVTNLVGRADLLAGFGVLAGLLCYLQFTAAPRKRRWKWLVAFVVVVTAGLFSKESAVAVVAVMLAYDLIFGTAAARNAGYWRPRLAAYLALAVPFLVFFILRANALGHAARPPFPYTDNPIAAADFWTGRLTAFQVIAKYFGLLLWPQTLSGDYSFNQIPLFAGIADMTAFAGLAACLGLLAAATLTWRKHNVVCWSIAFLVITLAPTANIIIPIGSIMAERFLYLPAIGFAAILVWLMIRVPWRHRWAAAAILALLAGARTYARNFDWLDDRSLWTSAAAASPNSYKVQLHLATALAGSSGQTLDQAIPAVDRFLAILAGLPDDRNVPQAYSIAGFFYRSEGDARATKDAAAAQQWYRKALEALRHGERIDRTQAEQIRRLNAARGIQTAPLGWHPLYLELGDTYLRLGQPAQALEAFTYGRILNPVPEFFEDMSLAYRAAGNGEKAQVTLWEGLLAHPEAGRLASMLARFYQQLDVSGCEVRTAGGTLSFNPNCPTVQRQACAAAHNIEQLYGQIGRPDSGTAVQRRARSEFGCSP